MNNTNSLTTYIGPRDKAYTHQTIRELDTMTLPDLLTSRTSFWYQSQTEGSAADLIIKIIDAKLVASDEGFARSVVTELTSAKGNEVRERVVLELGRRAKFRRRTTDTASIRAANRLAAVFIDEFCTESYAIDWAKLVSFVDRYAA